MAETKLIAQCQNCNSDVSEEDTSCPHCGIPLPPNHATRRQRRFIIWFILVVIFCLFMMLWLPPDWSSYIIESE